MGKKIAIRFDIDTITCMKDGVPKLVDISLKQNVDFTFFINFGKSIDRKQILRRRNKSLENAQNKLSSSMKLGLLDYILTIIFNPELDRYKSQISYLVQSNNEIGLHGGRNHGTWQMNGESFDIERLKDEINYALNKATKYNIDLHGFTSPGMVSNDKLSKVLNMYNFTYMSDSYVTSDQDTLLIEDTLDGIKNINVNLIGKNGVGYFEYYLAKKFKPKEIVTDLVKKLLNSDKDTFVLYDHPLILKFIEKEFTELIEELKDKKFEFVKFSQLL